MRSKVLGTIAAVAAGAGLSWGQDLGRPTPPPPAPIGAVGVMPTQAIGDPMGMPAPMGMPGPMGGMPMGGDPSGGLFPGGPMGPEGMMGGPMMGTHGQQMWQPPFKNTDKFDINQRLAPKMWVNTDYLLWFAKPQPTAFPFVTSSAPFAGGRIGNVSTAVLHSQTDLGYNLFSGFRVTGGYFADADRRYGWYASGFVTEQKSNIFHATSDSTGQPLLARPFFDTQINNQNVLLVSSPTFASGNVLVYSSSQTWGAEGGPVINLFRSCPDQSCLWNIDMIAGFRYLQVSEMMRMQQFTTLIGSATAPFDGKLYGAGAQIEVNDEFTTTNRFYGGQVGLNTGVRMNRWSLDVQGKIAIGVMNQRIDANGTSVLRTGTPVQPVVSTVRAGLFANASNLGRISDDQFSVIPEVNASLGYSWTSWLNTSVGYNFLYVSRVARPGDQFSNNVNPALVPTSPNYGTGQLLPTTDLRGTQNDFWMQGVSFGLNLRY
jgi:hypothetical protein